MSIAYLQRNENAPKIAYKKTEPAEGNEMPTVVFMTGFKSDMEGGKAQYLEQQCKNRGQGYIRFDYSGHGVSGGKFEDGTIGSWMSDALDVIDTLTEGPVILVGSSMGGWISLLTALERPEKVAGVVGIAAAPDFTDDMAYGERLNAAQKTELETQGYTELPNDYSDEPYIITKALVEDGNKRKLLDKEINITVPVRLVQGMKDADVEWQKAHRIKNAITSSNNDVKVILVEDGDHRMSRDEDMALIDAQVREITAGLGHDVGAHPDSAIKKPGGLSR